ncbi:MAG TPA: RhuM family protein [Candidatus Kapabacteria bacterium]|nr:RhuM family protein [Candidatus Kapabacteria bacterium]
MENDNQILIYQTEDGITQIETLVQADTVWLTQEQMAELFQKDRTVITRHINNIFKEGELVFESNVQKLHFPFSDKRTKLYNLDVIISVGYRVKSKRGTQFRIWANKILKEYLVNGYSLNEKILKLQDYKLKQLQCAIHLISNSFKYLNSKEKDSFLFILKQYSNALNTLDDYDYKRLRYIQITSEQTYILEYNEVKGIIEQMKKEISNSKYFGAEKDESLKSSISAIYQTYEGKDLYPTIIEKAVNLLYFLVKNHSFIDGNKRIAAVIFLYFLSKNNKLNQVNLDNDLLVTLTLMIANSNSSDKDLIVNIVSIILLNIENL